jgi:ligand-binding SRPBCC domain-containing protein
LVRRRPTLHDAVRYHHRFVVHAPLEAVRAFHARPAAMTAITPSPVVARVQSAPAAMVEGAEMAFTLWLGPLPIRWRARFEEVGDNAFVDRQMSGPFAAWVHRHTFVAVDDDTTEVIDTLHGAYRPHWFWGIVGRSIWWSLPLLFAYRARRTRHLLEQRGPPFTRPTGL